MHEDLKKKLDFEKHNLPNGWINCKIDDICKLIGGGTPSRRNLEYFNGDIVWLTPTQISKNGIEIIGNSKEKITELGLKKSSAKLIPKSSVLLTSRATIGYVAIAGTEVTTNQGFASFVCSGTIYNYYLAYWLFSTKDLLELKATGTTFKEISKSKLRELEIPLPPIPEQRRIVAKIESIFAQIDATKERLEALASQTKSAYGTLSVLKSSILKQAFEGNLVPQDPNDESAKILLRRIHKDFKKEWISKNNNLPKGWITSSVGQLYEIVGGGTPSTKVEKYWNGRISWISSADIHGLHDIRPRRKITTEAIKNSATNLVPAGSILVVTRVGLGKIAMTRTPLCFSQDSQALISNTSFVNPDYILYYLSQAVQLFKRTSRGTTISGVTKKQLSDLFLPIPPLNEQKRIVSKIESIFDKIDAVEKTVSQSISALDTLKQSVLKQAFEGNLIPQNPNDEPAFVLLERIKSTKPQTNRRKKDGK